jgi:excisionase family DNA binding protein
VPPEHHLEPVSGLAPNILTKRELTDHREPSSSVLLHAHAEIDTARKDNVMSSEDSGDEKLLTKGEVAQLCRVDVRTVDRWLTAGKLGCHRTPSGRVLFRKHEVLTVVARVETSPRRRDR